MTHAWVGAAAVRELLQAWGHGLSVEAIGMGAWSVLELMCCEGCVSPATRKLQSKVCAHACIRVRTCTGMCTPVCVHVCVCACVRVCVCVCVA